MRWPVALLVVVMASCGGSPTEPRPDPGQLPVTGTWSGLIRDVNCGDGNLTIEIEQFRTEFGLFFYGRFERVFPDRGERCNGRGSLFNGVVESKEIRHGQIVFTLGSANLSDCNWQFSGQRLSADSMTVMHTRVCAASRGAAFLGRR